MYALLVQDTVRCGGNPEIWLVLNEGAAAEGEVGATELD